VGYERDGQRIDYIPASDAALVGVRPVLREFAGWSRPTQGARTMDALPAEAVALIEAIEAEVGVPVTMVTTGAERDDVILRDPA